MSEDWFEVAYINQKEAILHGKRADGSEVRANLTLREQEKISAMDAQFSNQMQSLLRQMAAERVQTSLTAKVAQGREA